MACDHPKNYQLWHHRESIVKSISDSSLSANQTEDELVKNDEVIAGELAFLAEAINEDSKNFHAWSYR